MTDTLPPLPTFLIIGAQKSATRWLRSNLGEHPEVFAAPMEISFFNQRFRRGEDFYRSQFEGWDGEPIVGEATPGYLMWRHNPARVASRIQRTVPDVRLIVLLRSPIDRANSAMVHHVAKERVAKKSKLFDLVTSKDPEDDRLGLVTGGWYAASLQPYLDRFGDQLQVFLHDEVADDPLGVYRKALEHIGASPDFVPDELNKVVYSNQKRTLRRRSTISQKDREQLWRYFRDDVVRLEMLIDRDLSAWDPTPSTNRLPAVPADLIDIHERATAWVASLIAHVTEDDYDRPTPCPDWTVGQLLDHLVEMARLFTMLISHKSADQLPVETSPAQVSVDPLGGYHAMLADLNRELSNLPLKQTVSFGVRLPLSHHLAGHVVGQVGHGWDLAVATGQDPTIPDDLVADVMAMATTALAIVERAPNFAAAVPIGRGASPTDRFVAYLGRDPAVLVNI